MAKDDAVALVAELMSRLEQLIQLARQEGRESALSEIRSLVGGTSIARGVGKRGPGRPKGSKNAPRSAPTSAKPKSKRKNSWTGLSAEARLARINAIRKGKGLPPKE